jgi:hypothetical protein
MEGILISFRKITLTLVFLLLTILIITISRMHIIYNYLILGGIAILFIFLIKELLSKKGLYSNILFNGANVSSMIYILIVILRSILDPFIIISNTSLGISSKDGAMMLFNGNSIFILIIVIGLIIYNILMMMGEDKND